MGKEERISIHVTTRDRHTETSLLLQALRTQSVQSWDLVLLDDASGTPIMNAHFFQALINRIKMEGHRVKLLRNNISNGVCAARNKCISEDRFNNLFTCRLDDDCLPEKDYLKKLLKVIDCGYDIATGVIPLMEVPELTRTVGEGVVCEHRFNKKGELVKRADELAFTYDKDVIKDCHQFRTNALYYSSLHEFCTYPDTLTKTGFREELHFSFLALLAGKKIGAHLNAVAYHLQTPSGGCRSATYSENVRLDEDTTNRWLKKIYKKKGDFLR